MINILHLDKDLNIKGEIYKDDIRQFFNRNDPSFASELFFDLYLHDSRTGDFWLNIDAFDCLDKIMYENKEFAHNYDLDLYNRYAPIVLKYRRDEKIGSLIDS